MEVPFVLSYALLKQHVAEQIIDIPVPGGGDGRGGPQGFSSGQNSAARLKFLVDVVFREVFQVLTSLRTGLPGVPEQIDDIPSGGGLQGFLPRQGTLQRNVEQLFEIPVHPGGGPHLPVPGGFRLIRSFA